MRKRWLVYGTVTVIVCLLLVGKGYWQKQSRLRAVAATPPRVTVVSVRAEIRQPELVLNGSIEANTEAVIGAKIPGKIARVLVEDGDRVSAGQVLAELETTELENSVRMARAALAQSEAALYESRANYNRFKSLHEANAVSQQQLTASETKLRVDEANYEMQRAALANALEQLNNTRVRAPIDGLVANKTAVVGTVVGAGQPLMTVHDTSSVYVTVSLEQKEIGRIREGMPVEVLVDAYPGQIFQGRVKIMNPVVGQASRLFKVKAEIPNPGGELRPGMFAKAKLIVGNPQKVLLVPQAAVWYKDGQSFVFTVVDGKARQKPVTAGDIYGQDLEIRSGLDEGERVITSGVHIVKDGADIRESS